MNIFLKDKVFAKDLSPQERSTVVKVYRRYYRGRWYESNTPQPGYDIISYYATKVKTRLYHSDREDAQRDADKYNKRLAAYKQGRNPSVEYDIMSDDNIPNSIPWQQLPRDIRNPFLWPHNNSDMDDLSWLYEHADRYSNNWAEWYTRQLLREESENGMDKVYKAGNTTRKFFELIFSNNVAYAGCNLYWSKSDNRWYVIKPV